MTSSTAFCKRVFSKICFGVRSVVLPAGGKFLAVKFLRRGVTLMLETLLVLLAPLCSIPNFRPSTMLGTLLLIFNRSKTLSFCIFVSVIGLTFAVAVFEVVRLLLLDKRFSSDTVFGEFLFIESVHGEVDGVRMDSAEVTTAGDTAFRCGTRDFLCW